MLSVVRVYDPYRRWGRRVGASRDKVCLSADYGRTQATQAAAAAVPVNSTGARECQDT